METTTNKQEIIRRLNEAFENGDLELSNDQDSSVLLCLVRMLREMNYTNANKANEIIDSVYGVDID